LGKLGWARAKTRAAASRTADFRVDNKGLQVRIG
jgi:hypothetical protein